jgi:hypothetical protein
MVHYLCDYVVVLHILIYTPVIVPPWLKNKTLDRRPSRPPHTRQPWPALLLLIQICDVNHTESVRELRFYTDLYETERLRFSENAFLISQPLVIGIRHPPKKHVSDVAAKIFLSA